MSQRVLGDGCDVCNPGLAVELYKETIAELEQQLAQARREGWEQCQRECADITDRYSVRDDVVLDIKEAIAAMDYKEKVND